MKLNVRVFAKSFSTLNKPDLDIEISCDFSISVIECYRCSCAIRLTTIELPICWPQCLVNKFAA